MIHHQDERARATKNNNRLQIGTDSADKRDNMKGKSTQTEIEEKLTIKKIVDKKNH